MKEQVPANPPPPTLGTEGMHGNNDVISRATAASFPYLAMSTRVVASRKDSGDQAVYVANSNGLFRSLNGGSKFANDGPSTGPPPRSRRR